MASSWKEEGFTFAVLVSAQHGIRSESLGRGSLRYIGYFLKRRNRTFPSQKIALAINSSCVAATFCNSPEKRESLRIREEPGGNSLHAQKRTPLNSLSCNGSIASGMRVVCCRLGLCFLYTHPLLPRNA